MAQTGAEKQKIRREKMRVAGHVELIVCVHKDLKMHIKDLVSKKNTAYLKKMNLGPVPRGRI